ncbi:unnamed protein product, partial [Scytosiphon promiscuus]
CNPSLYDCFALQYKSDSTRVRSNQGVLRDSLTFEREVDKVETLLTYIA